MIPEPCSTSSDQLDCILAQQRSAFMPVIPESGSSTGTPVRPNLAFSAAQPFSSGMAGGESQEDRYGGQLEQCRRDYHPPNRAIVKDPQQHTAGEPGHAIGRIHNAKGCPAP